MPQSSVISLDLRKVDDWIMEDNKKSSISPTYEQKQNPPRVGWTINTLPTVEGARSTNLYDRENGNRYPPSNENESNLYTIDTIMDTKGNRTYLYYDGSLVVGSVIKAWIRDPVTGYVPILTSAITAETFQHSRYTLFQNRTLFLIGAGDTLGNLSVIGDTAATNAFFDIDLTNERATKYAVTGTSTGQGDKNGITSWGNYVILWNATTLYWSDPNVFTEFTVGGSSLAGNQKISEARGNIITIVPNAEGFVVYCQDNIIQASYSGDSSNPWIFREVTGGGGLLMLNGKPLVTSNEDTPYQVAYTTKGLLMVNSQEAAPMPERISDFVLKDYVETKEVGSSLIERTTLSPEGNKRPKLKHLFMYGNYLFLITGQAEEFIVNGFNNAALGRLYSFDMRTGKIGLHEGDFVSITPEIERVELGNGAALHTRNRVYANSFLVTRRIKYGGENGIEALRNSTLDLGGNSNNSITQDSWVQREAELFIGNITTGSDVLTELLKVELIGETSLVPQKDGGDDATRARVYVYSELRGATNPTEFIYYPKLDAYLGFVVGNELQVEIRGQYFDLTDIRLHIQKGGEE